VGDAFIAAVVSGAASFPVVHGHGSGVQNRFTVKLASGAWERLTQQILKR